jgi:hypothetical protein
MAISSGGTMNGNAMNNGNHANHANHIITPVLVQHVLVPESHNIQEESHHSNVNAHSSEI